MENLRTGHRWAIGADARACHSLSAPACNAAGSKLVFAYGPSALKSDQHSPSVGAGGELCLAPHASGIVLVSAEHPSATKTWRMIPPPTGCSYTSAAFDREGIAAFEACAPGQHGSATDDFLGPAFLVQLNTVGKVLLRIALKVGANPGAMLSDPRTGVVLVSQDQTYREHRPTYNWIWQLHHDHLRLIARYPFTGEGIVAAQLW